MFYNSYTVSLYLLTKRKGFPKYVTLINFLILISLYMSSFYYIHLLTQLSKKLNETNHQRNWKNKNCTIFNIQKKKKITNKKMKEKTEIQNRTQ